MEKKSAHENKMKKDIKRLLATLAVLLCIVLGFMLYLSWPLMTGTTIILATQPIDPFDIFRGQYIAIAYEISTLSLIEGAKEGEAVYVTLGEGQDKIWRMQGTSLEKPSRGIFMRGIIRAVNNQLQVEYGIEQYFFERHAEFPTTNLTVEAKVSKNGQARIAQLLRDGKPLRIVYQNLSLAS